MEHHRDENLLSVESLTKVFNIRRGLAATRFVAVDQVSLALQAAGTTGTEPNQAATSPCTLGASECSIHI